jgi:hypothetical protein
MYGMIIVIVYNIKMENNKQYIILFILIICVYVYTTTSHSNIKISKIISTFYSGFIGLDKAHEKEYNCISQCKFKAPYQKCQSECDGAILTNEEYMLCSKKCNNNCDC